MPSRTLKKKRGGLAPTATAALASIEDASTMDAMMKKPELVEAPPAEKVKSEVSSAPVAPVAATTPETQALETILQSFSLGEKGELKVDTSPEGEKALDMLLGVLGKEDDTVDDALVAYVEFKYSSKIDELEKLMTGSSQGGKRTKMRGGALTLRQKLVRFAIAVLLVAAFFGYQYYRINNASVAYDMAKQAWVDARDGLCVTQARLPGDQTITGEPDVPSTTAAAIVSAKAQSCANIDAAFAPLVTNSMNTLNNAYAAARISLAGAAMVVMVIIGYNSEEAAALLSIVPFMLGQPISTQHAAILKKLIGDASKQSAAEQKAEAITAEFFAKDNKEAADARLKEAQDALAAKEAAYEKEKTDAENAGSPVPKKPDMSAEKKAVRAAEKAVALAQAEVEDAVRGLAAATRRIMDEQLAPAAGRSRGTGSNAAASGDGEEEPSATSPGAAQTGKKGKKGGKTRAKKSKRRVTRRKARMIKFAY